MRRWTAGIATLLTTVSTAAVPTATAWGTTPEPRLTADVNRDGLLTHGDDAGKTTWTDARGAIFLPNLDDDEHRCRVDPAELDAPGRAVDDKLAACNDAADDRINGPHDTADLAPLAIDAERNLSDDARGSITITPAGKARVFANGRPVGALTAKDLRRGVHLQLEGRDVVRDPRKWDGRITVTLAVADHGRTRTDAVRLRVAPLLLQNDLQPAQTVLAARPNKGQGWWGGTPPYQQGAPREWRAFASTLRKATKVQFVQGTPDGWKDLWLQDSFEPSTASMPAVGGPHTMRILIRSGNVWDIPARTPHARPDGCCTATCADRTSASCNNWRTRRHQVSTTC